MTAFTGHHAAHRNRALGKVASLVGNAVQPGVLLLIVLALISFLSGLAHPEFMAAYGQLF